MIKIFYPRVITQSPFEHAKIISYRLIVVCSTTKRCILVQRKHTVEYLLLLLGHYRPAILYLLLSQLTNTEYQMLKILINNDKEYFKKVFIEVGLDDKNLDYAFLRFEESKSFIHQYILKNNVTHGELKYHFPGGRLNTDDKNEFECAKREFREEVEVDLPLPLYLSDTPIITETIKTLSSCKTIESHCWLYIIKDEFDLPPAIDNIEVNDRKWFDIKEAFNMINQSNLLPDILNIIDKIEV